MYPINLVNLVKVAFLALAFVCLQTWAQASQDVQTQLAKLAWQRGPAVGNIAGKATIQIPTGYLFLDEANTNQFLELSGNLPSPGHYFFAPEDLHWWSVFSFNASGYVKDDEKIDATALLQSLQDSDGPGNEERKRRGMILLYTDGWSVAPHYDEQTKRLEWGTRLRSGTGEMNVNYTSRLLGRTGVMSATLVTDTKTMQSDTSEYKTALQQFSYVSGEKYAEFKQGDKIAAYGLGALIVGGAAAVATKKGLWGVIGAFLAASWKIVAGVVVAAFAGLGKLFKRDKA